MMVVLGALIGSLLLLLQAVGANAAPLNAIGLRCGTAWATTSLEDALPYDYSRTENPWGILIGGHLDWDLPWDRIGLVTEVSYMARGYSCRLAEYPRPDDPLNPTFPLECRERYRNYYLSIPVLLAYEFSAGRVRPVALTGASIEVLTNQSPYAREASLSKMHTALHVGAGLRWSGKMDFQIRYAHDLGDTAVTSSGSLDWTRYDVVTLTVSLLIPL